MARPSAPGRCPATAWAPRDRGASIGGPAPRRPGDGRGAPPAASPRLLTRANRATPLLFLAPALVVMGVGLLYPIGYMAWASLLEWSPSQRIGEADFVGLRNFAGLLGDPNFRESLGVTLVFAASVVSIEMVLGVGLALLLDRQIRGMSLLRTVFILPMMIAPIVVGLIWRYMYHPTIGVFNRTLTGLGFEPVPWLSLARLVADLGHHRGRLAVDALRLHPVARGAPVPAPARRSRPPAWTARPRGR